MNDVLISYESFSKKFMLLWNLRYWVMQRSNQLSYEALHGLEIRSPFSGSINANLWCTINDFKRKLSLYRGVNNDVMNDSHAAEKPAKIQFQDSTDTNSVSNILIIIISIICLILTITTYNCNSSFFSST